MNIPEAMQADRTRKAQGGRRQLSRRAYGDLVGLVEQRIWAIENGKKMKPGELDKLLPHIGDLTAGLEETPSPAVNPPTLDNRTTPSTEAQGDCEQERLGLQAAYGYVLQRLHGHGDPPFPWPSANRVEAAPCEDLSRIREWIQMVHEWLDGVRPGVLLEDPEPQDDDDDEDAASSYVGSTEARGEEVEPDVSPAVHSGPSDEDPASVSSPASTSYPADSSSVLGVEPVGENLPAPLSDEHRYVTNGELRTWARCRRQWWFGYHRQLGLKAVQVVGAASVGTRVHRVLASYYVPDGTVRRDPWEVFEETVSEDKLVLDEQYAPEERWERWRKEVDLARAMVEGYLDWVEETAADAGLTITAPETRLTANPRIPELPTARLLAKLDVRAVRQPDGARLFLDHKTRQDLQPKTLHLDEQMLHYHLVEYLHLLDEGLDGTMRTDGAIYNMLRKIKRSGSARPPFFGRIEVRHNMDELRSYWLRVKAKVLEIEDAKRRLVEGEDHRSVCYPMPTAECSYQCDYFQLCPMYDDGSRAEDFVQALYVEVNPLRRYEPDQVGVVG